MSPLWGFGYLVCGVFYKHAAPLGLNAAQLVARYRSWGRGFLVQRVGEPNPYGPCATIPHCAPLERGDWMCRAAIDISLLWSERRQCTEIQDIASIVGERSPRPAGWGTQPLRTVCDNTTLRSSGARGLDVSCCYRHIAPLERKAAMHRNSRHCIHRGGEVSLPSGLGDPTPTDPTSFAHVPIFVPPVFRFTCRPSGALGYLVYAAFYKHAAPLGLKAAMHRNSRYCIHRGGEVSSPDGLGNSTPTDRVRQYHIALLWSAGIGCVALL